MVRKEFVKDASGACALDWLHAHFDFDELLSAAERDALHRRDVAVVASPP
jgi:hypothetical protein